MLLGETERTVVVLPYGFHACPELRVKALDVVGHWMDVSGSEYTSLVSTGSGDCLTIDVESGMGVRYER